MLDYRSRILLAKAARDAGFEIEVGSDDGSMSFASSLVNVWMRIATTDDHFLFTVDDAEVMAELKGDVVLSSGSFMVTTNGIEVSTMLALHDLAERAFQLARSMPTRPLDEFRAKLANLPAATEVERLVRQRVGQGIFRGALDDYWQGKCAATGVGDRALLRASHIVPWAECATDGERLDVFNGILLVADLDAAFDAALITFDEQGAPQFSAKLTAEGRAMLAGKLTGVSVRLVPRHQTYLEKHRSRFNALDS
jgi:putative restriction endonuclease